MARSRTVGIILLVCGNDFMTVYPLVFNVGPLQLTGFGIMMMIAFLVGGWVSQKTLVERNYSPAYAE